MQPEVVVYTSLPRNDVLRLLERLPSSIQRSSSDIADPVRVLLVRIGLAALFRIQKAFIVKSRGGTDETGLRWAPLSPRTIAYSRRHPGLPKRRPRRQYHPSYALTKKQRDRWWTIYKRSLARYAGDKAHAARAAWFVLKQEGATTLFDRYSKTQVDILRDTGLLLNSLSPVTPPQSATSSPPKRDKQIFLLRRGEVRIGTNRKGAAAHHEGNPRRKLPQRRLWPEPGKWTPQWWDDLLTQARQGIIDIVLHLLRR